MLPGASFPRLKATSYFLLVLCLALGVRLFLAVTYPGNLRADETFQYLEPAHHLFSGSWVRTWEWRAGIRSWLVPSFIASCFRLATALHVRDLVLFVRSVFACLSLLPIALFCWAGWQQDKVRGLLLFGLTAALWPDMVTAGIRPLGECFGGNLLASGVILAFMALRVDDATQSRLRTLLLTSAAFLLGCAAAVRFQFAPAVVVAMLYLLVRTSGRDRILLCLACAPPILALGLLDKMTLGTYYQSVFKNYYLNINAGIANSFGTKSFIYFPKKYASLWGGLTLAVIILFLRGWRYCRFPACIGLVIIGYHSLIGHKELSFIYPAIPLLLFCACYGLSNLVRHSRVHTGIAALCLGCTLWWFTQSSYKPAWRDRSEIAQLQQEATRQKDMCGLTFFAPAQQWAEWPNMLGYSIMPPGKTLHLANSRGTLTSLEGHYNYLIAYQGLDMFMPDLKLVDCGQMGHLCLYKKESSCTQLQDYEQFSRMIESTGQ